MRTRTLAALLSLAFCAGGSLPAAGASGASGGSEASDRLPGAANGADRRGAGASAADSESDRLELVRALERTPSPSQIHILLETLERHPSAKARAEAARALAVEEYRKPYALEALARAMADDGSAEVRRQAARGALAFEGHEAVKPLQAFLKNERSPELRRDLAVALATAPLHLDDSEATAALAAMACDDQDPLDRQEAAAALGRRGDPRALAALKRLAEDDPERAVRRAARRSVSALEKRRRL